MTASLARSSRVLAVLSTVMLAGGAAWFTIAAWPTADAGAHLVIGACLAAGLACSFAAALLVRDGRWTWAAVAALVAVVTPTGFAYVGNAATFALALCAAVIAVRLRDRRRVAQPA
ncbi:hypothetical protein [Demequina phytophila]|uniref:hypothetical protein n=1 Tax=Demequina phytophila TaxID=1638981 RepID=UPI0007836C84|nr:hypothetical protein [Demequina phytophila]